MKGHEKQSISHDDNPRQCPTLYNDSWKPEGKHSKKLPGAAFMKD